MKKQNDLVDSVQSEPLDSDSIVNRWVDDSPRAHIIQRLRDQKDQEEKTRERIRAENRRKRKRIQSAAVVLEKPSAAAEGKENE